MRLVRAAKASSHAKFYNLSTGKECIWLVSLSVFDFLFLRYVIQRWSIFIKKINFYFGMRSLWRWKILLFFCCKKDWFYNIFAWNFGCKFYFGGSPLKKFLLFSLRKPSIWDVLVKKIRIHQNNLVKNYGYVLKLIAEKLQSRCGFV